MGKKLIAWIVTLTLVFCSIPMAISAETPETKATRTIMLYVVGSNLESDAGLATYNLEQVLEANFSSDQDVRVIVMTGGTLEWFLDNDYLYDPATGEAPEEGISTEYNQIWEAYGQDAENPEYRGKLVLLDGDGLSGDGEEAKKSEDEIMNDPETLKAFINYTAANFPADNYDIILWDHGGGPLGAFAVDMHDERGGVYMTFEELVDAFADNDVTKDGGKFDIINFDACLMNSVDLELVLADYADYYIASPEVVPGYGEVYTHWLDEVGKDPGMNGFEVGKIIVDDFIEFYDAGYEDGSRQEGTLAVTDLNKLVKSDFVSALCDMNELLDEQLTKDLSFYDELRSAYTAYAYEQEGYYDLGNFISYLGAAVKEGDGTKDANDYAKITSRLLKVLNNESIIYAGGTEYIRTKDETWLDENGQGRGGELGTSGMSIFFIPLVRTSYALDYDDALTPVIAKMQDDQRAEFLSSWIDTSYDYALLLEAGMAVSTLAAEGMSREEINYDSVKEYWKRDLGWGGYYSLWSKEDGIEFYMNQRGGEAAVKTWLSPLIDQQAAEAVYQSNIQVKKIDDPDGTGHQVLISNTGLRAIESVNMNILAEVPEVEKYLNAPEGSKYYSPYFAEINHMIEVGSLDSTFKIGTVSGTQDINMDDFDNYGEWLNRTESTWTTEPPEGKWYAVNDADGNNHAAYIEDAGTLLGVPSILLDEDGVPMMDVTVDEYDVGSEHYVNYYYEPELLYVVFDLDGQMTELYSETHQRSIRPKDLKEEMTVIPAAQCMVFNMYPRFVPMSEPITITADNFDSIELIYTDIDNIPDIRDGNNDGNKIDYKLVVRDIYGMDTSLVVDNDAETLTSIKYAEAKSVTYNGKVQPPVITLDGKELKEGTDYNMLENADKEYKNSGEYTLFLEGIGDYAGNAYIKYYIYPALEDVPEDSWFADAVDWAIEQHITMGTSNTTFSPDAPCTRAQIVTFLWRAAGQPMPDSIDIPFTDVPDDAYYYLAVAWAVENNITQGTSATQFSPDATVTRGQTVTFLWRANGSEKVTADNPFEDVEDGQYYTDAVLWAVDKKVTTGITDTTFAPENPCTRAQIVTFLYRAK